MDDWVISHDATYTLSCILPPAITLVGLSIATAVDSYLGKRRKMLFLLIFGLSLLLIAQNYLDARISSDSEPRDALRTAYSILGYCIRPVILVLFCYQVKPEGKFWPAWVLIGVNTVMHLTALFTGVVFSIGNNHYHGGPLTHFCLYVSLLLLSWLLALTLRWFRAHRGREIIIPLLTVPIILGSLVLDGAVGMAWQPVSFLTIAIVCSSMLYYIWLHLQLVREHEQELRERQRMQIMLSQIKPHFLYNTLGAIEGLCDVDPKAAKNATVKFSRYLRSNLAAISEEKTVSFEQELSHARLYLELEQTRFGDALQVVYDIGVTDFFLPPLTLEPLVENAVRHGVRMKPDGRGTVTLSTKELPDGYEITVTDDGPGFDPNGLPEDGKPHIGIENVRQRLEANGSSLTIRSGIGSGTTATIRVVRS